MMWEATDELQWRRKREDAERAYDFIEVVWLDTVKGDPGWPDKEYTVVTGSVYLDNYSDEEIEMEITGYYDSIEQMCESYGISFECWKELDSIIAECIFESWENFDSHGMFTEEDAIAFAKEQMTK